MRPQQQETVGRYGREMNSVSKSSSSRDSPDHCCDSFRCFRAPRELVDGIACTRCFSYSYCRCGCALLSCRRYEVRRASATTLTCLVQFTINGTLRVVRRFQLFCDGCSSVDEYDAGQRSIRRGGGNYDWFRVMQNLLDEDWSVETTNELIKIYPPCRGRRVCSEQEKRVYDFFEMLERGRGSTGLLEVQQKRV